MAWWQFSLSCQASELERVENLLQELGAQSISLSDAGDDPIYEPLPGDTPVWHESIVTGIFDAALDHEELYQQLLAALPEHLAAGVFYQRLKDQDWEQAYRQHFKPLRCAPNLWIVPSWCKPPDPEAIVIRLDPGMAFGTGGHATTAICLAWLAAFDCNDLDVIDYGCGSGILAITACKRGAKRVMAIDIDSQALRACQSNMRINAIDTQLIHTALPGELDEIPVDLLLANILAGPLIRLAPRFASLVKSGGRILLSGILKTQLKEIQLAYQPYFKLDPACAREEWIGVSGKRV